MIMVYGLIAIGWNLGHGSPFHDESVNILMGREVLTGQSCPLCEKNIGSVLVCPVLSAIGDELGGMPGARSMGAVFGLGLTTVLYLIGRTLFSDKLGLLSAMIFLFTGTTLYLSKEATCDMVAAFFLGLSFLLILRSEKQQSVSVSGLYLFSGAVSLFVASVTRYTVAAFILPIVIYIFWKHTLPRAIFYFLLPISVFLFAYVYFAVLPSWDSVMEVVTNPYGEEFLNSTDLANRMFRWLGMPYLLSVFALFHEEKKGTAFLLIALSTPFVILHILSGDGRALDKDVIFSIVFLIPAMALGVDHMGSLFSSNISSSWVKPFFISAVLIIVWAFGIYELRWLEKQHPDLTPVISFLKLKGFNGMTVAIDSEYRYTDYIYRYSLEKTHPASRFISLNHSSRKGKEQLLQEEKPDFVVYDERHGGKTFRGSLLHDIEKDFSLKREFDIPFSFGVQNVKIFGRRKNV